MKKVTLLILAVLVIASVFAGCSASAYMDDPYARGYSNVSTTRNGTVNGTNGRYAGYGYDNYNTTGYNGSYDPYQNGSNGNGTTRSTNTTTTTGRTGTYTGTVSGTGMAGGR